MEPEAADTTLHHPHFVALRDPSRPAAIMAGSGETITFGELDVRINRLTHLLRQRGVEAGGGIAIFMENHPRFLEVTWAAQSAGLYYTAINSHLTADEAAYIVRDSGATVLVSSAKLAEVAKDVGNAVADAVPVRLMVDGVIDGWESYEETVAAMPDAPIADGCEGDFMLYSSGTTGRPKGIQRPLTLAPVGAKEDAVLGFLGLIGFREGGMYLSPAPLYHAAPMAWSMGVQRMGGTVVVMERFDPVDYLELVERYHITHSQLVPTMFVRMLKLDDEVRNRYDLSSLEHVVHAAAPCPPEVKRQMIEWWGPIILEYYSSTEGAGATFITSEEWLAHPGSVGRPINGVPHVVDEDGKELGVGEIGTLWFEGTSDFVYHNDPEKTDGARNDKGWRSVGDMGYVDPEGYVFLTDRKTFMIISGGVNIYPQESENLLITHPAVADVAVFGVPNDEMGEEVKAVVQPKDWDSASPELAEELLAFCRANLAGFKCPRSVDFERELPRLDTGKLYKRLLRDRYWAERAGS